MSIFREYDIRGLVPTELNHSLVSKVGYALGRIVKSHGGKVALGYDARTHSLDIFEWLASGLNAAGVEVFNLGLVPTPVAYFCTFTTSITNSIMITGSHNPPDYNGLKITIDKAPFYGEALQNLAREVMESSFDCFDTKPVVVDRLDVAAAYVDFLTNEFSSLKGWGEKIAFDCGNGVAGPLLEKVIENLKLDSIKLYFKPDGRFPNHHPDPSEAKNLADLEAALKREGAHIGLAYDGDGDRVALVSNKRHFRGDELAMLLARELARSAPPVVLGEVKCSQQMYDYINGIGKALMCKTGHSNLKVRLKEVGAHLACEMSGHIFFNDRYFGYDDALYASFRILELIFNENARGSYDNPLAPLEEVLDALPRIYSTTEEKIPSSEEDKFRIVSSLKDKLASHVSSGAAPLVKQVIDIDGVRVVFEEGWGLVRASNTTPCLVTRFEASTNENLALYKDFLLGLIS